MVLSQKLDSLGDMNQTVTARAPARVSVYLGVGAAHHDGSHDIATLYQAVSLYDEVTAEAAGDWKIDFFGPVDASGVPRGEKNLALRAVKTLFDRVDSAYPVHLNVLKRIPLGSGLGGASADAIAALVACNELWDAGLSRLELYDLAKTFGSEVPFALTGGTAMWTPDGDKLYPAMSTGSFVWVLAFMQGRLKAPAVFETLDSHRAAHRFELGQPPQVANVDTAVIQAIRAGDAAYLANVMHNDLQVAAMKLDPNIGALLELGESRGALAGIVAEAGTTVAFLVRNQEEATTLGGALYGAGYASLTVTGPVPGARRVDQPPTQALTQPVPIRPS